MKLTITLLVCTIMLILSCGSKSKENTTTNSIKTSTADERNYPYVTAKVNGYNWQSVKDEILASYSEFDDKLQIFTKDATGKMNFLITMAAFSKTGVASYNSVREGAGGFGISLLDDDKNDNVENDYDNFHQGAVASCIAITSIKETTDGKIVTGTFASPMNVSNNYDANKDKGVVVTDGKFSVFVKK